mgnify:CR=1 FL=1|tara:strand:- start:1998 stop:2201 length:204 start_codon:yes stop_codon:yes gene_type:complete
MRNKYIEEIDVMLMDVFLKWKSDVRRQEEDGTHFDTLGSMLVDEMPHAELMEIFLNELKIMAAKRND